MSSTEIMFGSVAEPSTRRVIFKPRPIGDEWQIEAHIPGGMILYIKGFLTDARAKEWIHGRGNARIPRESCINGFSRGPLHGARPAQEKRLRGCGQRRPGRAS